MNIWKTTCWLETLMSSHTLYILDDRYQDRGMLKDFILEDN